MDSLVSNELLYSNKSHESNESNADSNDSQDSNANLKVSHNTHESNADSLDSSNPNESHLDSSLRATHCAKNNNRVVDSHDSHKYQTNLKANPNIDSLDSPNPKANPNPKATPHKPQSISFHTQKSIAAYIKKFATLSGIKSLYPTLDDDFLKELLDDNINTIYDIAQSNYEKINPNLFECVSNAILDNEILSFDYKDKPRIAKPYKLSHIKGIWYLIAEESGKLKHFSFTKMQNIIFTQKHFKRKREILKQINDNQNLWLSTNPKSATISIHIKAKDYFLRKSLPKHISLIGYDDKKILIRFAYAFDDEIFNFLKIWIPYAQIKEPKELQIRFNEILEKYVGEIKEKLKRQGESNGESSESKWESSDSAYESNDS